MRWLARLALLLAVLLAYHLRTGIAPGHVLDEPLADGTTFLVDDPDAAYHLRRVQLALASGRVPTFDRFLDHPNGSPVPWPTAFDGALTVIAQVLTERDVERNGQEIGGHREADVERVLARVPPWLGAAAALAVAFALVAFLVGGTPASRAAAAALAALVFAATPIAVWYGASGRIDHHVAIQLLFALQLGAVAWSVRSREPLDAWTFALVGGVLGGAMLLVWLASAVVVAIVGVVLFAAAWSATGPVSAARRRAGALYFAAAAALVIVPAEASPWNQVEPYSLVNLTLGVPAALVAAIVPFVALEIAARLGFGRWLGGALAIVAVAVVVVVLPGFVDGVRAGFAWASRGNEFMAVVAESRPLFGPGGRDVSAALSDLGVVGVLFPLAWLYVAIGEIVRRRFAPERWLLLLAAAAWTAQTLAQRRFGDTAAVPLAMVLAVALHDVVASGRPRVRVVGIGLSLAAVALVVPAVAAIRAVEPEAHADLRDWRREVVSGLRWMRTGTPAPGPWNSAEARQGYGVLSPWGIGHLVEYHARRPTIVSNFGSFTSGERFHEAAAALLATSGDELSAAMRRFGARYVVVRGRDASDIGSIARLARWQPAERRRLFDRGAEGRSYSAFAQSTALWSLAIHDVAAGGSPRGFDELELVHASARREGPGGAPHAARAASGPVLSVWRLREPASAATPALVPGPR